MSDRKLARMSEGEVTRIIESRGTTISDIEKAEAELQCRRQFGDEARITLGYTQLSEALKNETLDKPVDVILLKTLRQLGIRPLCSRSVARYKAAKAGNQVNLFLKGFGLPMLFSGLLATIITIIAAFNDPAGIMAGLHVHWIWSTLLGAGAAMVWAEHAIVLRNEWHETMLKNYGSLFSKGPLVPKEALEIALRIRRNLSDVQFSVHHLIRERGPWFKLPEAIGTAIFDPDPFLEVSFGGEKYFVAVWDEPGFDGKLLEVE